MANKKTPIHTEAEYAVALKEVAGPWGATSDTPRGDRLDVLRAQHS